MKRTKSLALLVLVLFALTIVAGCGGGSKSGGESGGGEAAKSVKIGINAELSGAVASYGSSCKDGVMLAIDEINKAGGVNGVTLDPVVMDNKSDAAESTNVAARLAGEKVVAVIGPLTSGNVKAALPELTKAAIPNIAPAATADDVTVTKDGKVREYAFRTCFKDSFQGLLMADYFYKELKATTAAILVDNSNDYSKGLAKAFNDEFTKLGGQVVAQEGYVKGDRDFKATLTKIKSKNPACIYIPGYYEEVAPAVKQARDLGLNVPVGGGDGWDAPQLVEAAGKDALNNTFITSHYSSQDKDPKVTAFTAAFKAKYNKEPDAFAALGYDAVYMLADAMKRAGTSTDSAKITEALAATKDFAGVTGKMTVDEQHNTSKAGVIIEYVNGVQTMKTKIQP